MLVGAFSARTRVYVSTCVHVCVCVSRNVYMYVYVCATKQQWAVACVHQHIIIGYKYVYI